MHRVGPDGTPSQRLANKSRAPVPRFALVGNNRKLSYIGQIASDSSPRLLCCDVNAYSGLPGLRDPVAYAFDRDGRCRVAADAAATGEALRATAVGFASVFSRSPLHPVNTKANNRAMIRIRGLLEPGTVWRTATCLRWRLQFTR
jgi:hypothetical protein